ncbi:MAG: hypothetical protein QHH07_03120 [Sedimentisphaerales bacterium]|jgi:hypothetical protein|nr:hypothetical protein [Sedimentisphaerales bacterium]
MPDDGVQLDLRLEGLPVEVQPALKELGRRVVALIKEDLEGITVVGSCLTSDFRPDLSDINTLIVVADLYPGLLFGIARLIGLLSNRYRLADPIITTEDFISRTVAEFGIEWLDFQLLHKTIIGHDPLADLAFDKAAVLVQCKAQVKGTLIRLRQGLLSCRADRHALQRLIHSAAKALVPISRALLWLVDLDRPANRHDTARQVWEAFGIELQVLEGIWQWDGRKGLSEDQTRTAFEQLYSVVDQLGYLVEDLEV